MTGYIFLKKQTPESGIATSGRKRKDIRCGCPFVLAYYDNLDIFNY